MELTHRFTVPASIEDTWAIFNDIGGVASCFPGADIGAVDGDACDGSVKVKLGPISMQYAGMATCVERDEPAHRLTIHAAGKDSRGQGTADATMVVTLSAEGAATAVDVTTDLAITGKPAQFGRGMIQDVSDTYLGRFVDTLSQRLGPQPAAESSMGATPPSPPPAADVDLLGTVLPGLVRRSEGTLRVLACALACLALVRLLARGQG